MARRSTPGNCIGHNLGRSSGKGAFFDLNFASNWGEVGAEIGLIGVKPATIVPVLSHFRDMNASMLTIYLPYIPFSLAQLLKNPNFSPFNCSSSLHDPAQETTMIIIAKSIAFQTLQALAYLHDPARNIAHRDIKPSNILLEPDGRVVLIDFGVAWDGAANAEGDLWPESPDRLYFEVCTGAYRPPELLFGARAYNAPAIDMWSFGTVLAEMFCTLRLCSDDGNDGEEPIHYAQAGDPPFVVPTNLRAGQPETYWVRDTLFNGGRGEIGLAWSIFKIHGTPTEQTWPTFRDLPGASSVDYMIVPRVPLRTFLPNLPADSVALLDFIEAFFAYPPNHRLAACQALNHAWFDGQIVLPRTCAEGGTEDKRVVFQVGDQELAGFLGQCL
ncbi:lanosterol 14-alpha-demethylase [Favolaschia claudopus]|uniref:cyclin-dependent kinase n=1 Tax=Favolaschia claudopus TaxID=2862362 RepID=A0AAW0EF68_9AGAR